MPVALYVASILGALALWMILPKHRFNLRTLGALLGAATLGGLWLFLAGWVWTGQDIRFKGVWWWLGENPGRDRTILPYYYIFSFIAIAGAVRVITHTKPVFAALWFIMVVLASAGLFIVLSAEFMAFAMVIIYGGAIVVTYMFVIMLAAHSGDPQRQADAPEYDRIAREPLAAVFTGFLLLAVLLAVAFPVGLMEPNEQAAGAADGKIIETILTDRSPPRLAEQFGAAIDTAELKLVEAAFDGASDRLTNVERIGLDLFRSHPLGLELAGVVLLVALIGAVVIARTHVAEEEGSGDW